MDLSMPLNFNPGAGNYNIERFGDKYVKRSNKKNNNIQHVQNNRN